MQHTITSHNGLLALAIGLALAGPAQAQSLQELFDAAKTYDASFAAAKQQFEASQAKADQAKAGILPTVGVSAGTSRTHTNSDFDPIDSSSSASNVTLAASQPLYRPANKLAQEQAEKSREAAQAQLDSAEQDLVVRTAQAYFDVLGAQDSVAFVQAQKKAVSEQLAAAKRNFEVGTSTITDTREAQARFDLVVAQEIAAENDLRVKKLALDQLVGKAGTTPWKLTSNATLPSLEPLTVEPWVERAESTHPSVRLAMAGLSIATLETEKAQTGHLPTLDVIAQYQVARNPNTSSSVPREYLRNHNATIGLQFNLPLFAGFAVQNRVRETVALEEKSRADLDAAKRGTAQATRAAFFGVVSGMGQVKALEAAEASSQSALDANLLGYQVGVRINIDVLNAQSQLYQTKASLAKARYDVLVGGLRLKQASGVLTPADLNPINALLQP